MFLLILLGFDEVLALLPDALWAQGNGGNDVTTSNAKLYLLVMNGPCN